MAEHDYNIANAAGATVRSDLNNALSAIHSNNTKATAPTTIVAGSTWGDTTLDILKIRNHADNAWYSLFDQATGELLANLGTGLIVNSGDSGGTATATFGDSFIVENSASCGISILSPDNSYTTVYLGDVTNENACLMQWRRSDNFMRVGPANVDDELRLIADTGTLNVTLSGTAGSELFDIAGDFVADASGATMQVGATSGLTAGSGTYSVSFQCISDAEKTGLVIISSGGTANRIAIDSTTTGSYITTYGSTKLMTLNNSSGGSMILEVNGTAGITIAANRDVTIAESLIQSKGQQHTASGSETTKTIATGTFAITSDDYLIKIDAEGAPTTDDLDTITGGTDGQRIRLLATALDTITIQHNAIPSSGEFFTNTQANVALGGQYSHAEFINYSGVWVQSK